MTRPTRTRPTATTMYTITMLPFIIVIMVVVHSTTNPSSLSHVHAWKQCDQIIQQSSILKDSSQEHVTTRTIQSRTCTRKYRKTAFVPNQEEEDEEVVVVQQGSLVRPNTSGTPTARTIAGKANTAFILSSYVVALRQVKMMVTMIVIMTMGTRTNTRTMIGTIQAIMTCIQ